MLIGKLIRLERITSRETGRTVIVPMDHGTTLGPVKGLANIREAVQNAVDGGANAVIAHKGIVNAGHRGAGRDIGLIVHLNASTMLGADPNAKILVCKVEEAVQIGADAVSLHVNIGSETEPQMLKTLGEVSDKCSDCGMPLLAMMYARGNKIDNPSDVKYVKHAARVGAELGADIIKCVYTGHETFHEVIESCPVPVVIAGGDKIDTDIDVLEMVKNARDAGAMGVSIGRNVFQHKNPKSMVAAICSIIHENASVEQALEILRRS